MLKLTSHPDWITLRERAISYARANMETPPGCRPQLTCIPNLGRIWQWDSCLMALYAGYTPDHLDGLGNLDNLYSFQREDGFIGMAYDIDTKQNLWGERINPPLYAWVEWLYARRTGDTSRLERAWGPMTRLHAWIRANRRRPNGLYWFEDTGSSGMDNSPRSGYAAYDLHGSDVCFVDLSCQQVLAARCLAKIGRLIGRDAEADAFDAEADELADLINKIQWCDKTGFYHDVFVSTNNKLANKTAAAFWAIVSGVATGEKLDALCTHLRNPETFGTRHPVPTLSRDDPNYRPDGGYWLGGVWAPINYMVVSGLRAAGRRDLAREIAARHLDCMAELLGSGEYDTIWECYSPDYPEPAHDKAGKLVRRDFVGFGATGPLLMLPEDILGLDIDALSRRIDWYLGETGLQGMSDLPFNGGAVDLELDVTDDFSFKGLIRSDTPLTLNIFTPDARHDAQFEIAGGPECVVITSLHGNR